MMMRTIRVIIVILATSSLSLSGQIESDLGKIAGFTVDNWYDISIDESILERLSQIKPAKNEAFQFAFPVPVKLNPENSGFWKRSGNEMVWTIGIRSKNARSLNLILSPFHIPEGAFIYLYNSDKTIIRGAFGTSNNNPSCILPTAPLPGDKIILEYHIPAGVDWKGTIGISQVAHDYRGILASDAKDSRYNMSQFCNVDINCSAGADYELEKRAVCRIIIRGTELCTGFLVNNTNQQNRALLVTAQHCIVTEDDAVKSVFVFGYESPWCDGPDGRVLHSISGSSVRSTNESIDFTLVELTSFPPYTYKPYLAGWDVTGAIPQKTATIHHPQGDVKKITIDQNQPVTSSFLQYASNSFWKILAWESGTTEGGSSGAPLFDQNKRVVGFLSGGLAECGRSVDDYFAKLSVAYNYSSFLWQQLKGWIDPAVTGLKTYAGRDPYAPNNITVDTLYNIIKGETTSVTKYPVSGNGYATGYNSDSLVMYAEYFANPAGKQISEVLINVGKVNSVLSVDSVSIYVFADGSVPGNILARQNIFLSEAKDAFVLHVDFKNTVPVSSNFYIGWKIWYKDRALTEPRQFAVFQSPDRSNPLQNSAWFNNGLQWKKFTQHPSYPVSASLDVKVITIGNSVIDKIIRVQNPEKQFLIYPNPANHRLSILSQQPHNNVNIEIYDSRGSLVSNEKAGSVFPGEIYLDLHDLINGIYFVVIRSGSEREYHKLIIAR